MCMYIYTYIHTGSVLSHYTQFFKIGNPQTLSQWSSCCFPLCQHLQNDCSSDPVLSNISIDEIVGCCEVLDGRCKSAACMTCMCFWPCFWLGPQLRDRRYSCHARSQNDKKK